jgi:class 3 adenylate cyclase
LNRDPEDTFSESLEHPAAGDNPLAQVRHDLRNAVDQILGYSELLRDECRDRALDDFDDDLARIQTAARRIMSLIDGLLADASPGRMAEAVAGASVTPAPEDTRRELGGLVSGRSARLLVVDDDRSGRELLTRRLERQGYEVATEADGESALRRLEEESFDLLLLDLEMPGLGGVGTLASLRRRLSPTDLPVIMVTGRDDAFNVVATLRLGANDYIVKPFDQSILEARVSTHLTLSRLAREAAQLSRRLELRSRFLRQVFGRYLTDEVVESLLTSPLGLRLGGERRVITVLMADLRGFSAHAERLEPEQAMTLLNEYLSAMTDVIVEAGGTIDEFLGDAILVFFGAPLARDDHARAAVQCALQMQQKMDEVRDRLATRGLPRVELGVGVHTGEVVVGNIGSEKRAKFGAVGRAINLAARIEGLTAGGQVLISGDTYGAIADSLVLDDTFEFNPKGEPDPIVVHEVRGIGGEGGLELPELTAGLQLPSQPLHVTITRFRGKELGSDSLSADVVRLSERAAEIRLTGELEVRSDLRLELPCDDASEPPAALYAKVVAAPEKAEGSWRLRFTWVPSETAKRIETALGGAGD